MGGNEKTSATGDTTTRSARRPKTVTASKGKHQTGAKNSISQDLPRWRIKLHDTTTYPDDDGNAHVNVSQVEQVLKKQLQWVTDADIILSVEGGMFTPDELAKTGPDTLNQVLLCQVATKDQKHAIDYLEYNIASLLDALKSVGRLHFNDTGAPRTVAENVKLWDPEINWFAYHSVNGVTPNNTRLSVVSYFYATDESDEHNRESKAHPGEWECHVCEHEIGHTFLQNGPGADTQGHTSDKFFVDVMHPPYVVWLGNYEWVVHMTPDDVAANKGPKGVSKSFFDLPNAAVLSQQPGLDDVWLYYKGYPGYSNAQKDIIIQTVWDTFNNFQLTHDASSQKSK
jgi:hypothetical protein